jgi:hypothetical protein
MPALLLALLALLELLALLALLERRQQPLPSHR